VRGSPLQVATGRTDHGNAQLGEDVKTGYTAGARLPAALVLRAMPHGKYAVDNDKTWDTDENVLSDIVSPAASKRPPVGY
jgi:hypothetical protein